MRTFFNFIVTNIPTPILPKENSGASGGFLLRPLLLRLRHPNSKKISRVFCEILPPKNSFCKTESALVPPRLCEAVAGLIHSFNFRSKKVRAKCIITAQWQIATLFMASQFATSTLEDLKTAASCEFCEAKASTARGGLQEISVRKFTCRQILSRAPVRIL